MFVRGCGRHRVRRHEIDGRQRQRRRTRIAALDTQNFGNFGLAELGAVVADMGLSEVGGHRASRDGALEPRRQFGPTVEAGAMQLCTPSAPMRQNWGGE